MGLITAASCRLAERTRTSAVISLMLRDPHRSQKAANTRNFGQAAEMPHYGNHCDGNRRFSSSYQAARPS